MSFIEHGKQMLTNLIQLFSFMYQNKIYFIGVKNFTELIMNYFRDKNTSDGANTL